MLGPFKIIKEIIICLWKIIVRFSFNCCAEIIWLYVYSHKEHHKYTYFINYFYIIIN